MAQVRVRPVQHAEVRQPRHRDAVQRAGAVLPSVGEGVAVGAGDADRVQEVDGAEARGEDDGVVVFVCGEAGFEGGGVGEGVLCYVDSARRDVRDGTGFEADVGEVEGRVVVV